MVPQLVDVSGAGKKIHIIGECIAPDCVRLQDHFMHSLVHWYFPCS